MNICFPQKYVKFIVATVLFCLIYYPPLFSFNILHLIGGGSLLYIGLNIGWTRSIIHNKKFFKLIVGFMLSLVYLSVIITISDIGTFSAIYDYLYFLMDVIPFGIAVTVIFEKNNISCKAIMDIGIAVAVVQAILSSLAFMIPSFHMAIIYRMIDYGYPRDTLLEMAGYRLYGFANGMSYSTAIFQSLMAIIALNRAIRGEKKYYIASMLLGFSGFVNARTSMIVIIVGIGAILFLSDLPIAKKFFFTVLSLGLLVVGVMGGYYFIFDKVPQESANWIMEGIEEIINFVNGDPGRIGETFFAYMVSGENWKLPEKMIAKLFGTGAFSRDVAIANVGTDIGYVNDIWRGGLFFATSTYLFFYIMMSRLLKNYDKDTRFYGILCMLLFPLLNIKGQIFGMNDVTNFLIVMNIVNCYEKQCLKYDNYSLEGVA